MTIHYPRFPKTKATPEDVNASGVALCPLRHIPVNAPRIICWCSMESYAQTQKTRHGGAGEATTPQTHTLHARTDKSDSVFLHAAVQISARLRDFCALSWCRCRQRRRLWPQVAATCMHPLPFEIICLQMLANVFGGRNPDSLRFL